MKKCLERVRSTHPLVHCITNYVTVNDVANALLACGGSPIMSDDIREVGEITAICSALDINIGTLNASTIPAMLEAGKTANRLGHPVVLDPVGAGASALRTDTALSLMKDIKFDVIRGNISEIKTLAGERGMTSGVDASEVDAVTESNLDKSAQFIKGFAKETGSIVAVTGKYDLVSDGCQCYIISNGVAGMSRITGTGCQLSALVAAFVSANPDNKLKAVVSAVCMMGLAGEIALAGIGDKSGNCALRSEIIDTIYRMDGDTLEKGAKYEIR